MHKSAGNFLRKHLNPVSESHKALLECEANEKLCRVIRSKVRPANSLIFQPGDHVFYKRNKMWKGPGIAIGKENKQILVKHGGQYISVHTCRLQLKNMNNQLIIQSVPDRKFDNKPNELSAVEPENSGSNIFKIIDEEIVSINQ